MEWLQTLLNEVNLQDLDELAAMIRGLTVSPSPDPAVSLGRNVVKGEDRVIAATLPEQT